MTAEQLNIKLNLDISDITAGVKKVKTQLSGMADKVKQSIPKIDSESKKAKKSLEQVGDAGDDVKKSIANIGTEATASLGKVSRESSKVVNSLKSIKANSNISFGYDSENISESTGTVNNALDSVKSRITALLGVDIFKGITDNWEKISGFFKRVTEEGWYTPLFRLKEILKDVGKTIGGAFTGNIKKARQGISYLKYDTKLFVQDIKGVITNLTKEFKILAVVGIGAVAAVLATAGASIANSTKQFREEQTKLNSAFSAAGATAKEASQAYNGLFRFLGESSRSVESANHLAKITTNTQHLAEWTTICQGIYSTFGDSLPIESLTEAANETIRVSKVTGVMADALNWAGVSEDAFNAQLEKTTSLTEREALVRRTLMGLYQNAAAIYEQNNKAIIAQNEAQARLDKTMARIGQQTQVLVTSWINLKNTIMTVLAPAITYISAIFSVLIDKLAAAIQWVGKLIGIEFRTDAVSGIVSGVSDVSSGIENATGATGGLTDGLNKATDAAEKLRRVTMGFDELNIVSDLSSKSSSTDSGSSGTGTGAGGGISSIDTGNSMIGKIGEQIEDVKAKVEDFFEKWKTQIAIISAALAALGIAGLLEHLGKAISLGDTFLKTMKAIKNLAVGVIVITLQYALVNDYMDKYIDGKEFKDYIKGLLVAAIGTGVLYAMWGTGGLALGLGVTAVASIKAVIDNGGINSVESAVVALTGLVSAIGAISIAIKKINWAPLVAGFGKIKTALTPVVAAVSKFVAGLSGGAILGIAAIIAGIASAAYFLYENWDKVTKAAKEFFNLNILPKLQDVKKSWEDIKTAVSDAAQALLNAIPPELRTKLEDLGKAIVEIKDRFIEWAKSVDWIKGIGKTFEVIGGIIFSVVTGVIAGAMNAFIGYIQGAIEVISGITQIVSGVVEAIVALFSGDLQEAGKAVDKIVDGIQKSFKGLYDKTIGVVVNLVKGIIDWFVKLWDELVGHSIIPDMCEAIIEWFNKLYDNTIGVIVKWAKDIIEKISKMWEDIKSWFTTNVAPKFTKSYWTEKFDTIRDALSEKLNAAKKVVTDVWNLIKNWFNSNVAQKFTKQYWATKFDTIRQAASDKINAAKSVFTNAWNSIAGWFRSSVAPKFTVGYWTTKFNTIKDGARAAFNGIISVVEKAVNGIINKINTLSWEIPDWVPVFGGDRFGFNFRTISIPRLATGGIATSSSIVNVGEAGKEAILPLDRNTGWMDILADKIAARQGTAPTKVALVVDGKELGWATIRNINAITKQTGGLQLAL